MRADASRALNVTRMPGFPTLAFVICVTTVGEEAVLWYTPSMGRFSKVVLLSLLLMLAGVPSTASLLCAQPVKSHPHACCMGQGQANASHGGDAPVQLGNHSCCKMVPVNPAPAQNLLLSSGSNDGIVVLHAVSDIAGDRFASILVSGRGSPLQAKLQHSPVQAFLCTFLV